MNKLQKILEIRESLSKGSPSIGSWMQIPNTSIAEVMGQSQRKYVFIYFKSKQKI